MKNSRLNRRILTFAMLTILALPEMLNAQYFSYSGHGDLLLGFRKTTGTPTYELVVNLGNITNLLALPQGTTVPINSFSTALSDSFSDYNNLQWSASAAFNGFGSWAGFAYGTMWYTQPRFDPNIQSTPLNRSSSAVQNPVVQSIKSIASGAATISAQILGGATNADNNASLVREPSDPGINNNNDYAFFIRNNQYPSIGDFNGFLPSNAENTTPATFTSPQVSVSDLYQSVSAGSADPNTGTTSGPAYYVGYFTLSADGSMTFTRASTVVQPPTPQIVGITHTNGTSTVYFTTANGATYTLYYTDAAGLNSPIANWTASATTVTGNGQTNSLSDTATDTVRFYRIGAR